MQVWSDSSTSILETYYKKMSSSGNSDCNCIIERLLKIILRRIN